jgi:hypothetical protein
VHLRAARAPCIAALSLCGAMKPSQAPEPRSAEPERDVDEQEEKPAKKKKKLKKMQKMQQDERRNNEDGASKAAEVSQSHSDRLISSLVRARVIFML